MAVQSDTGIAGSPVRLSDPLGASVDPGPEANRRITDTRSVSSFELHEARLRAALITRLPMNMEDAALVSPASGPGPVLTDSWQSTVHAEGRIGTIDTFILLPARKANSQPVAPYWRIQMCDIIRGMEPLCFDILDDVVIGRGSDADLDFYTYGIYERTISRRHAMLRPTPNHLYLIDMSSRNGTFYNSVPLGRCATYPIMDGDTITLGTLNFVIKIVSGPRAGAAVH